MSKSNDAHLKFNREAIFKKVKAIELSMRKNVDDVLSGNYKSHFKGQGVQFSEHREYVPGDDIRHIDWKVSARTRDPLIKKFDEERELNVFLVIDISSSTLFGSQEKNKIDVIAEVSALCAFAAVQNGDKVGALLFGEKVVKIVPPKKGRNHVQRLVQEIFSYSEQSNLKDNHSALKEALDSVQRVLKHSGIVFVIGDFQAENYEFSLKKLARKHDVISVYITDPNEWNVPSLLFGAVFFNPLEGKKTSPTWCSPGSPEFQRELRIQKDDNLIRLRDCIQKAASDLIEINTKDDYAATVVQFFQQRKKGRTRSIKV